jgi:N-acetyl sugar amidotransferase
MKYCQICLQTDTRPNTKFTKNQICPACFYFNTSKNIDWEERLKILENIFDKYSKKKQHFDCIIGVSGGKDSTRQALWIRDKLKKKPLLVSLSYPPDQITERGAKNISNLINLGFDVVISSVAPVLWKKLMKTSFLKFANWAKPTELALFCSVPQIAIKYNINLIIWGENPALQFGDNKILSRQGYDGNKSINSNTLSGGKIDWMLKIIKNKKLLIPFIYPTLKEFNKNIKIIYLGWFINNWSNFSNSSFSIAQGLNIRSNFKNDSAEGTGDIHISNSLDEDWVSVNQLIKYYKYGFGRTTDYISEDIRNNTISRNEAIKIVENYDHKCDNLYIKTFCSYIQISEKKFWEVVRKNTNKKLFTINNKGKIIKKFKVGSDFL